MNVTNPSFPHGPSTEEALARALSGRATSPFETRLVEVLHDPVFLREEDLRPSEQCALSYERMRFLVERLDLKIDDLFSDLGRLLALHEWTAIVDGTLTTLLTIHYNLCVGSILRHGGGRPELSPYLAELERLDSVGVFLATELGYGNNVQSLETEAAFDAETREFVIHSPRGVARKFMPNTGAEGIPKLAVVMARLRVNEADCGVFPFVVRVRTADGICPGVRVTPLGDKPDFPLDNAMTSFDRVRVPHHAWLSGSGSHIDDAGVFSSDVPSPRRRFLASMDRVQAGKLCLGAASLAMLRGAVRLTLGYSQQRTTFAPGRADVPILSYSPQRRLVFEGVATVAACATFLEQVATRYRSRTPEDEIQVNRLLALGKVFVSSRSTQLMAECRERVGAQGLFCANRIISYWVHTNGIVTAEGDNEVLVVKSARELLLGAGYEPPIAEPLDSPPILESVDFLIHLAREQERLLHARITASMSAAVAASSLFDVWNSHLARAAELVHVHTLRLVLESFDRTLDDVDDGTARGILERLLRLFALRELQRFAAALMVGGLLDPKLADLIGAERDRLATELYPDAALLTEALNVPASLVDAPIGGDYVEAYEQLASEPAPRNTFIRTRSDAAALIAAPTAYGSPRR